MALLFISAFLAQIHDSGILAPLVHMMLRSSFLVISLTLVLLASISTGQEAARGKLGECGKAITPSPHSVGSGVSERFESDLNGGAWSWQAAESAAAASFMAGYRCEKEECDPDDIGCILNYTYSAKDIHLDSYDPDTGIYKYTVTGLTIAAYCSVCTSLTSLVSQ